MALFPITLLLDSLEIYDSLCMLRVKFTQMIRELPVCSVCEERVLLWSCLTGC